MSGQTAIDRAVDRLRVPFCSCPYSVVDASAPPQVTVRREPAFDCPVHGTWVNDPGATT